MNSSVEDRNCPICDSTDKTDMNWLISDEKLLTHQASKISAEIRKKLDLSMCNYCKLVYYSVIPSDLKGFYTDDYRKTDALKGNKHRENDNRAKTYLFYRNIQKHLKPGDRILDVGCSEGMFVKYLRSKGYNADGLEINKFTVEMARKDGLKIYDTDILETKFPHKYDFVFTSGYIEHVKDPRKVIQYIRDEVLTKDGFVYNGTPNALDPNFSFLSMFFPPEHVQMFCPETFNNLMESCGFKAIGTKTDNYNFGLAALHQKTEFLDSNPKFIDRNYMGAYAKILKSNNLDDLGTHWSKYIDFMKNHASSFGKGDTNHIMFLKILTLLKRLDIDMLVRVRTEINKALKDYD